MKKLNKDEIKHQGKSLEDFVEDLARMILILSPDDCSVDYLKMTLKTITIEIRKSVLDGDNVRRSKTLEELMINKGDLKTIMDYIFDVLEGPWPEAESIISTSSRASYEYSQVIKKRFKKGEPAIANNPPALLLYVNDMMNLDPVEGEAMLAEMSGNGLIPTPTRIKTIH